jgi:lipopolysaccharide biosynthesis glycosyltransferase
MIASRGEAGDKIDVAFCIDDAMALPLAAALLSLAATRRHALRLHLLIDGSPACRTLIRGVLSFAGLEHDLIEGTPEQVLAPDGRTPYGLPSTAPFRRLMLADRLPALDRILYLDADILVRGDLRALWETALEGRPVGAVLEAAYDPASAWLAPYHGGYFNSGVLLLDLARWRAEDLTHRVADCIAAQRRMAAAAERGEVPLDPPTALWGEQTPLNLALAGRWKALPPTWNLTKEWDDGHGGWRGLPAATIADTLRDPRLFHFASSEKPWLPAYARFTRFHEEFQAYRRDLERRFDVSALCWPVHNDTSFRLACRVMALQLVHKARARGLDDLVLAGKPSWLLEIAVVARRKGLTVRALVTRSAAHRGGRIDDLPIIEVGEALGRGLRHFVLADIVSRLDRLRSAILEAAEARGITVALVEPDASS